MEAQGIWGGIGFGLAAIFQSVASLQGGAVLRQRQLPRVDQTKARRVAVMGEFQRREAAVLHAFRQHSNRARENLVVEPFLQAGMRSEPTR